VLRVRTLGYILIGSAVTLLAVACNLDMPTPTFPAPQATTRVPAATPVLPTSTSQPADGAPSKVPPTEEMNPGTPVPLYTPTAGAIIVTVRPTPTPPPTPEVKVTPPVVVSARREGRWELYVRNPDGSKAALGDSEIRVSQRSWSPDGEWIVFSARHVGNRIGNLYLVHTDKSGLVQLTDDTTDDWAPAWSPDGARIAFVSIRNGQPGIYVMEADGSNVIRLTDIGERSYPLCWSPDGTRIAFMYHGDNFEIYVVDADGGNLTQLTTTRWQMDAPPPINPWSVEPAWSPDGTRIAFSSLRGVAPSTQIYVVDIDGSDLTRLTVEGSGSYPAWSPDGERIAFTGKRGGEPGLYIMDADGSNVSKLASLGSHVERFEWSPDGEYVVFISRDKGERKVYRVRADGSRPVQLLSHKVDDWKPIWAQ
jgi:Tol biopolymer transport system component